MGRMTRFLLRRCLFAIAVATLLSGCAVDQQKEVALYRDVLHASVPPVAPYADGERLTLPRAMALANQNNEQLGLRGEEYVQSLIAKNRATAAFLPTVSFQPSYTVADTSAGNGSSGTGPGGTGIENDGGSLVVVNGGGGGEFRRAGGVAHRFEAPVVGNVNLFRGLSDVANLKSAESQIAQRRELLVDLQATVLLNVAQVYYQVLRSERSADVLQNTLAVQEARLKDVQQQFKNGLAIKLSVAQTQAQVDATRVLLTQARSDVRNGRHLLALLIGVSSVDGPLSEDFAAPANRNPVADFEQRAIASRQDLLAAEAGIESARHAVDAAIGQYYPSVSLNVGGFLYREYYGDSSKWSAILAANVPIFSAGLIHADVRNAWSQLRQAALNESYIRRQVVYDVRTAYENLVTADERIKDLKDQVAASEEAYQQARNAFQNNLAINLDVLSAQDVLLNSQLQLTGAQFDRTIFYLDLLRATGRMSEVAATAAENPASQPAAALTTAPSTQRS